jgi:DnaK suppressor protein
MADDDRTALFDGIEADLAGIDAALARLEAGTYFACETCGADLAAEQLSAMPTATRCGTCAPVS